MVAFPSVHGDYLQKNILEVLESWNFHGRRKTHGIILSMIAVIAYKKVDYVYSNLSNWIEVFPCMNVDVNELE